MAATAAQAAPNGQAGAPDELATSDEVKEYCHEGEGENTEHLNSMDLHDIKTELEKDAEAEETPKGGQARNANTTPPVVSPCNPPIQLRPTVVQPMVYTNGFMVPQFAATPTIYPVAATASIRPVKMELQTSSADWIKSSQGISIPYSYQAGLVPSLSMDQSIRQAYPFIVPGQYVTPMQYQQQLTALGTPAAPNAMVQPHSGIIAPQQKDKKPHVKKPLNAFMLFMKEKRGDVIKECTLKESAAINQILGKMWHKLDKSEQAKYYEMAREERTKHMQMYPGWSARDNYAIHKKRRKKKAKPKVDDNDDDNPRKCRARYGMDQQHMWCGSCRRKKKCIRASEGDEEEECESKCEGMTNDANTSSAEGVIANSGHQTESLEAGSSLSATLSSKSTPVEESVPSSLAIKQEAST